MKSFKSFLHSISLLLLWVVVLLLVAVCKFVSDVLAIVRIILDALDRAPRYMSEHLQKLLDV